MELPMSELDFILKIFAAGAAWGSLAFGQWHTYRKTDSIERALNNGGFARCKVAAAEREAIKEKLRNLEAKAKTCEK